MSTTTAVSRRDRRASRALIGGVLVSLALGLTGAPVSSAAGGPLAGARPMVSPLSGPVVTADLRSITSERRAKRRFGPLKIGISTGFSILDAPPVRQRKDITAAKRLGASQLRLDISWAQIQPEPGVFNWEKTDRLFRATRAQKVKILAVIGFAPEWGEEEDGEVKPALFGQFVSAAVKRYGPKVAAWELWNEPNQTRSWIAKPDPAVYARTVEAASAPIRRFDPKAKILMGALAPAIDHPEGEEISPETFLKGVYRAKIDRSSYDAVSIHPFSYPAFPSGDEEWNTFHRLPQIYRLIRANGDGRKPLWLTEYGARTGNSARSVSLARQTRLLKDAYRETRRLPFVEALFFYSLRDMANNRREPEANFGLLKHNGQRKPVYGALRREIRKFS